MRNFLLPFLCLLTFCLQAQEPLKHELSPCGTPPGIHPWLAEYITHPQDYVYDRSNDTLYAGVQVHLLAKDNGTGRFSPERLLNAFCRLNLDFTASRVRFYFNNDWNYIDSTAWYQHGSIEQGIEMMLANDVPGAQNTYFVSDPAGNCGYNLPYASIAIAHACAPAGAHTWAHEIGHALSLPHPFIGWEEKVYSYQSATPLKVTYDYTYFHDTIDTQIPAPLDTALVEFLDGSNCQIAADMICDTKPDYLSYGWDCDAQGYSLVKQKDPSGAEFYSDGSLFMSYAYDNCQNRFTDEQIAILRANLMTEKADWLTTGPPEGDITELPVLKSPVGGEPAPEIGAVLTWEPAPNATHYLVQYSRIASFANKEFEAVTTDTSITIGDLVADKTYYWRVRPFNYWYPCALFAPQESFKTVAATKTAEPDADGWRCYPSLLGPGQSLVLEIPGHWLNRTGRCDVYDASGRLVWQSALLPGDPKIRISPPSENWPSGVYRLLYVNEIGAKVQSFVLMAE